MKIILCCIIIVLTIYFDWELVRTTLMPLVDIAVAIFFIFFLMVVIVTELALIVIAPVALLLGYDSRAWHVNAARKLMFVGRDKNADTG